MRPSSPNSTGHTTQTAPRVSRGIAVVERVLAVGGCRRTFGLSGCCLSLHADLLCASHLGWLAVRQDWLSYVATGFRVSSMEKSNACVPFTYRFKFWDHRLSEITGRQHWQN